MGTSVEKTSTSDKRDEIIRGAFDVFYKEGFHASGVDSLLEGTGISKRTLYKYFESKEDLIQATILYYAQRMGESIAKFADDAGASSPTGRILATFDWLEKLVAGGHVIGCFAINAKLEYVGRDNSIEQACDSYFMKYEEKFTQLCREAKLKDAKKTGRQLHMLFQGAIVNSQVTRDASSAQIAKAAAKLIIENAAAK